jgi:hypothetical protein
MPGLSFFKLVVTSLAKRGVTISSMEYLVPQPFVAIGNSKLYLDLLRHNQQPAVPKI